MSIMEHTHVPAGWYPDGVADGSLRWWDGTDWTNDVRSVAAPALVLVPQSEIEHVPAESLRGEIDSDDIHSGDIDDVSDGVSAPMARADGPHIDHHTPLTRRQLREMLGGPLVIDVDTNLHDKATR